MLTMLVFWDAAGEVIGTLDHLVQYDEDGKPIGLTDFEAYERAGGRLRDIAEVSTATGAGSWPEWIGGAAHGFSVELDPSPGQARAKVKALVHKTSGHRRERDAIEAEIVSRIAAAQDTPADLRDLLGGPNRPLKLDAEGRTQPRAARSQRPNLPVARRAPASPSEDREVALSQGRGIPKNAQDV